MPHPVYEKIYRVIRKIPSGKVATYGQIALLAGIGRQPRRVGYALSILAEGHDLPWHRVINAKGAVSSRWESDSVSLQEDLLRQEGIVFNRKNCVPLKDFLWQPGTNDGL